MVSSPGQSHDPFPTSPVSPQAPELTSPCRLNIPFAQPPVGPLRFAAPLPVNKNYGIFDSTVCPPSRSPCAANVVNSRMASIVPR